MIEKIWKQPPEEIGLSENDIHVWRVSISGYLSQIAEFREILSDDEITRADRFYFEKDRNSFTVSRAMLRIILGGYLNIDPGKLIFKYNQYGKPYFADNNISFNLSHSGDFALYAVSDGIQLGIDVEFMRDKVSYKEICARFFSVNEVKALCDLPEHQHKEAFFNGWTRKEAYIKAKGKGLAIPLNQFDVSLVPGEPAMLLESRDEPGAKDKFTMYELFPGDGYKGALIARGENLRVFCWDGN
jgi:4'-phosphopantetheinyl transferase